MKNNRITIVESWGYDQLYPILQDAFRVLYISYQKLYTQKHNNPYMKPSNVKKWPLEDLITDDLVRDEEKLPKKFDYRIVNQQKDAIKKTRIDIALQYSLKYGYDYDIKIECKLLKKKNIDYIINEGIQRFKTNKYGAQLPLGGMLFYNTFGSISENIKILNEKIGKKISCSDVLNQSEIIKDYPYTYISNHQRHSNRNIDIYTLVFNFKNIMKGDQSG